MAKKSRVKKVECTGCGGNVLIIPSLQPGTTKKGHCYFGAHEPVLIPVGSHLCDFCEDHFRRD